MRTTFAAASLALIMAPAALAQTAIITEQPTSTTTTTVVTEQPSSRVIELPPQVRTYVTQQSRPSVVLEEQLVVGQPLPDTVEYQIIPEYDGYAYTVVNNQKVIVDPKTRSVIEVYD
jgi:hypothetical protein